MSLALVLLLACDAGARAPTKPPPPIKSTEPALAAPAVPAGWVPIAMTDELKSCGNYSNDEWQVAVDARGDVVVTKAAEREGNTGPELPFAVKADGAAGDIGGRRHTLAFGDGYLVGFDAGEWGGGLYGFGHDGKDRVVLGDANVHGLAVMKNDLALSLEGLAHMSTNEGAVRWIERTDGAFRAVPKPTPLPDEPLTFVSTDGAVYVITWTSLVKVSLDRSVQVLQKIATEHLYADSMTVDRDGALWVGMRQFVLRLVPGKDGYTETWFTRESCRRMEKVDLNCICR